MSVWTAYEGEADTDGWSFHLLDVRCECGWFLSDAEPVMGLNGVRLARGHCKRHGVVDTGHFAIYDAGDTGGESS